MATYTNYYYHCLPDAKDPIGNIGIDTPHIEPEDVVVARSMVNFMMHYR
jgi:hypothetical protein